MVNVSCACSTPPSNAITTMTMACRSGTDFASCCAMGNPKSKCTVTATADNGYHHRFLSLNHEDAVKRFKAADTNSDCAVSKSEHEAFIVDDIIDPVAKAVGFSLSNNAEGQADIKSRIQKRWDDIIVALGTNSITPANFAYNLDGWKCPQSKSSSTGHNSRRELIGRSVGAYCKNMCSGRQLTCCGNSCVQGRTCPASPSTNQTATIGWIVSLLP